MRGLIVFGSLMGAMFIGQQFLQNVLGYSPLEAGASILPAVVADGDRRTALGEARRSPTVLGSRSFSGYVFCLLGFLTMLLLWERRHLVLEGRRSATRSSESVSGFAGTPASHSLTGSVPVQRAGMASGTADLQRDLGGAIMQSILGALLTAGYAAAFADAIAGSPNASQVSDSVENQLTKSFASAANIAEQYPQYSQQIIAAAKQSFIDGSDWAYTAGIVAILLGAALVYLHVPEVSAGASTAAAVPHGRHRRRGDSTGRVSSKNGTLWRRSVGPVACQSPLSHQDRLAITLGSLVVDQ